MIVVVGDGVAGVVGAGAGSYDITVADEVGVAVVSDDGGGPGGLRTHVIDAGGDALKSPLLALGNLGFGKTPMAVVSSTAVVS